MALNTRILAVDIGGTNIRSAVVEETKTGLIVLEDTFHAWKTGIIRNPNIVIARTLDGVRKRFGKKIAGVAWDVAGPVIDHSIVPKSQNMKFLKDRVPFPLKERTQEMSKSPTIVCNDLEAAVAGEREHGSLEGVEWAMLENIGTGYGGARILNGMPIAAEPGHAPFQGSEALCGCGNRGCIEAEISGGAIQAKIEKYCAFHNIKIPQKMNACAFADQEANRGVQWAVDFYTKIAEDLGKIWGGNLNNIPLITHISYMGSFLIRAMKIECFRNSLRRAMIQTSQFPDTHKDVVIAEVKAPMYKKQPLGPLLGSARIWLNEFSA